MKPEICPQEMAVTRAARAGHGEESLQAHAAGCAICREIVPATRWMQALARQVEKEAALPDASLLWWKARLAQKQGEVERAQRPLEWAEVALPAIIAVGVAGWLAWNWPSVPGWLARLLVGLIPQFWRAGWSVAGSAMALSTSAVFPLVVVLCVVVILVAHPILAED